MDVTIEHPPVSAPLPLRCKCGHVWSAALPGDAPVQIWLTALQMLRCPQCGKGPKALVIMAQNDE